MDQYNRIDHAASDSSSLALESLVSSDNNDASSIRSVSSRGISPLTSPIRSPDMESRTAHNRTESISTLGEHLFDLTASSDAYLATRVLPLEKQKRLNITHGIGLVVGLQVGSGIFASPREVNSYTGSVGGSLITWALAGALAWTGASCYAELGSAIPLNGSSQAYLRQIFGPLPSFLFSWTAITVMKPGSIAIISLVFAEYFCRGMGALFLEAFFANVWTQKFFALVGLSLIAFITSYSTTLGANTGTFFLLLKIMLLLLVTAVGLAFLPKFEGTAALTSQGLFEGASHDISNYAIALYAGLWSYDGWENCNYIAAEMKNPRKDIPRVIHTSMPIVIVGYMLANLAYYAVMSIQELDSTNSVATTLGNKTLGRAGGVIFSLLVSLSCVGALNATVFSSCRLVYSAAEDGFLPEMFGTLNQSWGTPVNGVLLEAAISCIFILSGEFRSLVTFYGVAGYAFYFLTVAGLIVLRFKEPDLERPYKTWLTTPILFCCIALFLISRAIFERPLGTLLVTLFILSGIPIYYWKTGVDWSLVWDRLSFKTVRGRLSGRYQSLGRSHTQAASVPSSS